MMLPKRTSHSLTKTRSILNRMLELPDLARTIQALPVQTFAALVREVGLEDAGEFIALATTEQLVQVFDEELFVSDRAGQRETLDMGRFVVWLEVLLEAGDEVAGDRVAELDEDFVVHALSGLLLVLDEESLRSRLDDSDEPEALWVDKALESALADDIDGYILISKRHDGWDAALALVLALDRNHRALLVRLLDRLARVGSGYLDDLDELSTVLTEGESLAEDVEAAREERRSTQGYVEAQAARAFLTLARKPLEHDRSEVRDSLTRAYFREIDRSRDVTLSAGSAAPEALLSLPPAVQKELHAASAESAEFAIAASPSQATAIGRFMDAMRELGQSDPEIFEQRMEELTYLANVLLAGHDGGGARLRPEAAADAALATVCYGAVIEVRASRGKGHRKKPPNQTEFAELMRKRSADLLFRVASAALATGAAPNVKEAMKTGLLFTGEELEAAIL